MQLSGGDRVCPCHSALSLRGPSGSPGWRCSGAARWTADSCCASRRIRVGSFVTGSLVVDAAGHRRSPATMPGFHAGRPPHNKGLRYPADPPTVEAIVAVMRIAGDALLGRRLRGLVVVLWRAGLRIDEALALRGADLDRRRGSLLVRHGKGGRRREVGMDDWGWQELEPWLAARVALPIGPLFCIINGRTRGRPWTSGARAELRRAAARVGVRRRFAPHQLRHAHAVEMAREGVPLIVIQRQLGTATSGSRWSICRASTTPKSSNGPCPPRPDDPGQRVAAELAAGEALESRVAGRSGSSALRWHAKAIALATTQGERRASSEDLRMPRRPSPPESVGAEAPRRRADGPAPRRRAYQR
jgi:hypothetical protein